MVVACSACGSQGSHENFIGAGCRWRCRRCGDKPSRSEYEVLASSKHQSPVASEPCCPSVPSTAVAASGPVYTYWECRECRIMWCLAHRDYQWYVACPACQRKAGQSEKAPGMSFTRRYSRFLAKLKREEEPDGHVNRGR